MLEMMVEMMISLEQIELREEELLEREFVPLEMDPMMEFVLKVMNPEKDLELLKGEVLIELVEQKGSCATEPELLEKR